MVDFLLQCSMILQAVADLAEAIAAGRAQAAELVIVAMQQPAAVYQQMCSLSSPHLTILDGFSDPYAWGSLRHAGASSGIVGVVRLPGLLDAQGSLDRLQQELVSLQRGLGRPSHCIVVDSLSPLLDRFGLAATVGLLQRLQAAPGTSCLLCALHQDVHPPQQLAAVEQLAAGTLRLAPCSELERTLVAAGQGPGSDPQGRLTSRLKRRTGRVRADTQLYCVDGSGGVSFFEPPAASAAGAQAAQPAGEGAALIEGCLCALPRCVRGCSLSAQAAPPPILQVAPRPACSWRRSWRGA